MSTDPKHTETPQPTTGEALDQGRANLSVGPVHGMDVQASDVPSSGGTSGSDATGPNAPRKSDEELAAESSARSENPSAEASYTTEVASMKPESAATEEVSPEEVSDEEGSDEEDSEDSDEEIGDVEPLELIEEPSADEELKTDWYILKVQVNREDSIRDALQRRVKVEGMDRFFKEIVVPTEDVAEFTKTGKRRVVKRKLYPGYIMVNMHINDETWFLVRETPGIGDFTGSAGKPTPMLQRDVERILNIGKADDGIDTHVKTAIPFKQGDRVRVKDGYFQNFEGDVESVDEANGRVTVMINIFGRSTPVELEHWQIEAM